MKLISEFVEGNRLVEQLLVLNVSKGVNATTSQTYLSIEFKDASGSISGKKWDATANDEQIFVVGNVVEVAFEVIKYRENLQLKIINGKSLDQESVDVTKFIKNPPVPMEELKNRFIALVVSIKDEDCRKLLNYFMDKFKDKLYTHPAASSIHHEYRAGLLMHSVTMGETADYLAKVYPNVNRDLLVTASLMHDMGKMIELEGPVVFHYSLEGKLLGHISIMASEIRNAAAELGLTGETPLLLAHMVLAHHGQLEFGSPVLPLTKEALLLSLIDNLDSKMVIAEKALETTEKGAFTQKIFPLDGRTLYKAK